ncbi:MAG: hypothetical protein M0T86_08690 [Betaproteobacteria bacterium]|nr:hypothetical protein [Betaproteobacteria bacterium]
MVIWTAQRTVLIVGEGADEVAFLNHVKHLYVPRGCGLSVKIKNAQGKGARHVVNWTARQMDIGVYDKVAALLDTDADWSPAVNKTARERKIQVLTSEPCFEALMLRVLGENPDSNASALKRQFAPFVNNDATQSRNYANHFSTERLQAGCLHEPTIKALLNLIKS